MPNPVYTYKLSIFDLQTHFVDNIFNQAWAHLSTELNGFKYSYQIQIILLIINHLFVHS